MIQFGQFPLTTLCVQVIVTWHNPCWVSPFGNPRIISRSQIPEAYRRVLRPSSVLIVKASTISALNYLFMH